MTTKLEAIASSMGADFVHPVQFKAEYLYQAGRTKKPIFTDGNDYFCMSTKKPTDDVGHDWEKFPDQFWAQQVNSIFWISKQKGKP
jgi:hypothetical protein